MPVLLSAVLTSSRGTSWTTQLVHEFTVDFGSETNRSEFFRLDGEIRFSGSRSGGSATSQNTDWTNLLVAVGTQGFASSDNDAVTGSYTQFYTQGGSGAYAANDYTIRVKEDSVSVLRFQVQYNDDHTGVSDTIDGTIDSTIDVYKELGLSTPSLTTITELTAGS